MKQSTAILIAFGCLIFSMLVVQAIKPTLLDQYFSAEPTFSIRNTQSAYYNENTHKLEWGKVIVLNGTISNYTLLGFTITDNTSSSLYAYRTVQLNTIQTINPSKYYKIAGAFNYLPASNSTLSTIEYPAEEDIKFTAVWIVDN